MADPKGAYWTSPRKIYWVRVLEHSPNNWRMATNDSAFWNTWVSDHPYQVTREEAQQDLDDLAALLDLKPVEQP